MKSTPLDRENTRMKKAPALRWYGVPEWLIWPWLCCNCMNLKMQAQYQPDIYTDHKRYYPANNIYAKVFFFSNTQNILNIESVKRGPTL